MFGKIVGYTIAIGTALFYVFIATFSIVGIMGITSMGIDIWKARATERINNAIPGRHSSAA